MSLDDSDATPPVVPVTLPEILHHQIHSAETFIACIIQFNLPVNGLRLAGGCGRLKQSQDGDHIVIAARAQHQPLDDTRKKNVVIIEHDG